jgi:hypothetical protein
MLLLLQARQKDQLSRQYIKKYTHLYRDSHLITGYDTYLITTVVVEGFSHLWAYLIFCDKNFSV